MLLLLRGAFAPFLVVCVLLLAPREAIADTDVSGHVTARLTGQPIAGVRVSITEPSSPFTDVEIGWAITDADGFYEWVGACGSIYGCSVVIDDPPYMIAFGSFERTDDAVVLDFALTLPATASGTVRFPEGDPAGARIDAQQFSIEAGEWINVSSAAAGSDGRFTIDRLPPAPYRFCTTAQGAVPQCFDHVNALPTVGDPDATLVDIAEGSARDGIDFDLIHGGSISGTVMDGYRNVPFNDIWNLYEADVYDVDGMRFAAGWINSDGTFYFDGLPDGTYYLGIAIGAPYGDGHQFYPGVVCDEDACPPPTAGTPLTIAGGNAIAGRDFTVHPDVVVRGNVFDAASGDPIGDVEVEVFNTDTYFTTSDADAATGEYIIYAPADTAVEIEAFGPWPYVATVYPAMYCMGTYCVGTSTLVSGPRGSVLADVDVPVPLGASIGGAVRQEGTGLPADAEIELFDADFNVIWHGEAYNGGYSTDPWLPGTYYVEANAFGAVQGCAFYEDRPCPEGGGDPAGVDPTPIVVVAGETRDGIDFSFAPIDPIFANGFEP